MWYKLKLLIIVRLEWSERLKNDIFLVILFYDSTCWSTIASYKNYLRYQKMIKDSELLINLN